MYFQWTGTVQPIKNLYECRLNVSLNRGELINKTILLRNFTYHEVQSGQGKHLFMRLFTYALFPINHQHNFALPKCTPQMIQHLSCGVFNLARKCCLPGCNSYWNRNKKNNNKKNNKQTSKFTIPKAIHKTSTLQIIYCFSIFLCILKLD